MSIPNLQKLLYTILLRSPLNLFDECTKWYSKPAHSLSEIRLGVIFLKIFVYYILNILKNMIMFGDYAMFQMKF